MKAFVIKAGSTSLEGLEQTELDQPQAGPGEILVEMKAASLNFRDLAIIKGVYVGCPVPRDTIPLSDGSGLVVATGKGVTRFKTGDRIAGTFFRNYVNGPPRMLFGDTLGSPLDGNLCEYAVFNERDAVMIPDHLSFAEAATLPCAGVTAWHALMVAGKAIKPGDRVLVLGTGGVSIMALQFARMCGAEVIATSSSDEKLARVSDMGASHTINYKTHPDWHEQVLAITDGEGADCVVEVGGAGTLSRSMQALAHGGKIGMIGVLSGMEGDTNPRGMMFKCGSMHGIFVGSRAMFEDMNQAISVNEMHPVIDRTFNFDDSAKAYQWMQSQSHFGKVVIEIG